MTDRELYSTTYTLAFSNPRLERPPYTVRKYKWYEEVMFYLQLELILIGMVLIASLPMIGYLFYLRAVYD